jgi:hypothetical protein
VATALVVSALVGAVLRAPFKTIELGNDQLLFRRKFRTDAVRLGVPAAAALVGASALPSLHLSTGDSEAQYRRRRFALSVLGAWTYVMAAGIVLGLLTLVLPPARFLAHLVAFPGAVAVALFVAAGSVWVGRRLRSPRWGRIAAVAIAVVALGLLAVPGILRWYRYPVLMDARALQEARTAGGYVRMLPAGQPVIFVVDYAGGKPGVYGPVMSERTLRIAVPAERALDVHLYVGSPADLLAGRRTPPPDERSDRVTLSYWRDVQPLLSLDPPVLVLQAMAGPQFEAVRHTGATVIAPGVALLRGPKPLAPLSPVGPAPPWVPSLWSGLGWGAAVLVLLFIAGVGWSLVIVPTTSPPETVVSMMPVVGAGSLILGGLLAALAGVHLGTWGGVGTYLVVAFAGGSAAVLDRRRLARRPPRAPGETRR